jgi:hypothetical protein
MQARSVAALGRLAEVLRGLPREGRARFHFGMVFETLSLQLDRP